MNFLFKIANRLLGRAYVRSFSNPDSPSGVWADGICGVSDCGNPVPSEMPNQFYCSHECIEDARGLRNENDSKIRAYIKRTPRPKIRLRGIENYIKTAEEIPVDIDAKYYRTSPTTFSCRKCHSNVESVRKEDDFGNVEDVIPYCPNCESKPDLEHM